ncbi:hypothetical protein KVK80_00670 [Helicobacter pylori]|uniref:Lipoprotein n=1 Tax=Helicobacter pylori Hp P-15 TaxID=992080 RepID=J0QC72_HELPX|nr:hypothetical protein [Helicobacter pylori]EJB66125.1 hypothetical protein HPHPH43_0097 [Helicobacter pylori Hp H-43]EJC08396.1 hypothetical protein HPHPP15_0358 [Helicobacter pylori Hp P-15]EJC32986.1 hypothetical protein HPHPP15B_0361 [Helicobacter pylori Hp P-15b]MCQ2723378.1 hypothetical protein [Helicobacter pylori]PDX21065.1 hypothetical protein BB417_06730 [Helicobacter pylori]
MERVVLYRRLLLNLFCMVFLQACLKPMSDPKAEKVDSQVQCGFGSKDC